MDRGVKNENYSKGGRRLEREEKKETGVEVVKRREEWLR